MPVLGWDAAQLMVSDWLTRTYYFSCNVWPNSHEILLQIESMVFFNENPLMITFTVNQIQFNLNLNLNLNLDSRFFHCAFFSLFFSEWINVRDFFSPLIESSRQASNIERHETRHPNWEERKKNVIYSNPIFFHCDWSLCTHSLNTNYFEFFIGLIILDKRK